MSTTTTLSTLLLDTTTWDLTLDANSNIALAKPPTSVAQDVASAVRTFLGECWYNTTIGVPYNNILGNPVSTALLTQYMNNAALTVPGVLTASTTVTSFTDREVHGTVEFTTSSGTTSTVNF